jgi:hypothetical protein
MRSLRKSLPSAACWLLSIAAASGQAPAGQANGAPANDRTPPPDILMTSGRMAVNAPKQALHLGEKNAFDIDLKGPALRNLVVGQSQPDSQGNFVVMRNDQGQELTIEHRADGTTFVNVVPIGLGTIEFEFSAAFADGGFEQVSVTGRVVAARSARSLELQQELIKHEGEFDVFMAIGQQKKLWLQAGFDGVPQPLDVAAKDIQFKVHQTGGSNPSIRFDPATGAIDSLRLGDALIEGTYAGATVKICVIARERDNDFRRDDCAELQEGGNGILPTEKDADAPGASWGSKLPYTADDSREGRFVANDRVEIVDPGHPLYVAEENPITMRVHGGTVVRVECGWSVSCVPRDGYNKPPPPFTFEAQPNGDVVVQVFPDHLESVPYEFTILFADGGVAHKTLKIAAGFGTKQPKSIDRSCGNDSYTDSNLPVRLVTEGPTEPITFSNDMWSSACYDGIPGFVVVPPQLMTFRVWGDNDDPPINVNAETGQVAPLHSGQALLEREFRGQKSETCFVVETNSEAAIPNLSNCRALRTRYGAPLPELPQLETDGPHALSSQPEVRHEQEIRRAKLSPDAKDRFNADDRLQIVTEGVSLPLGEPGTLAVNLKRLDVLETVVFQDLTQWNGRGQPAPFEDFETDVRGKSGTIEIASDGSASVTLVAQRLRTAEFRIHVLFADGGVAAQTFKVAVRLPDHPPLHLTNALDGSRIDDFVQGTTLHLLQASPSNMRRLFPVAWYRENRSPIHLSAADVKFDVRQQGEPVIRLNQATGELTALRLGHAVIETSFAGAKSETCVVVMADLTQGDPSNCEELLKQK